MMFVRISWPRGRFSIPKPKTGCPSGWAEGWRYQDNEDSNNINSVTPSIGHHFFGTFGRNTKFYYCTKTTYSGSGSWPSGNYCIARYGGSCPSGLMDLPTVELTSQLYTSTCQRVRGMTVREELVKMDDEDDRNNSSDDDCHPKKTDTT
ncbi:hypothetical protein AM593_05887, partial [Mytilus galloprovincialis]